MMCPDKIKKVVELEKIFFFILKNLEQTLFRKTLLKKRKKFKFLILFIFI